MAPTIAVVSLDGSSTAESVLPWAVAVGKVFNLHLELVQLVREAWPGGDAKAEAALQPARHYLQGVASSLDPSGLEIRVRAQPVGDDIAAGIVGVAQSLDAAIIMLATHGRTGFRRLVMGSVADGVARTAECPVLVVRGEAARQQTAPAIKRVLLPLDGSTLSEEAIAHAARIAATTGATLDLMQAVPWSASLLATAQESYIPPGLDEQMEAAAADYLREAVQKVPQDIKTETHILRGDAAGSILDHSERTGADIVVMSSRGRSGVARWALGSVADKVLRAGDRPVLLVHNRPAEEPEHD